MGSERTIKNILILGITCSDTRISFRFPQHIAMLILIFLIYFSATVETEKISCNHDECISTRSTTEDYFRQLQSIYRFKEVVSVLDLASENSSTICCKSFIEDDIHAFFNAQAKIPLHITGIFGNISFEELFVSRVTDIRNRRLLILIWSSHTIHRRFFRYNILNPLSIFDDTVNAY
jgi:hypothetical protein